MCIQGGGGWPLYFQRLFNIDSTLQQVFRKVDIIESRWGDPDRRLFLA